MPASTRRIYVDANVLLAYLGNETGHAEIVQALLDEARRSEIEIITSVLSIAEVAFGAQERDAGLTPEGEAQIDTLWQPASPITLVDVSQATAREARSVIREAKTKGLARLRSMDAMHLASARLHGADEIFTYEVKARSSWQELTGLPVNEPSVTTPQLDYHSGDER